ncbi:hypothetical protein EOA13_22130 [Mesorhizobium sp. M7A.F.Ca.US.011.01.1.1]|uniref:hypothetical protein n=1 Tax=Mesorhizobium sp. M7A.F.Ca.US.011.01.1.1 TaxID=2496741 RepID=UPI000FCAE265|nr:hypothetical protein [Mesorhizobium sp. M7A.F.Ca.US.011.01.1.1]RUX26819.1 hypothetical protein EOA13_22130 [Mesorhizobium sp. M7A.F.Ca.US.011.01.1.1]
MSATINRKALSAFMQQCLDPLPDAALVDTHHNHLMRRARAGNWRKAGAVTGLAKAEQDYLFAKSLHAQSVLEDAAAAAEFEHRRQHCVERRRQAIAEQIRAPAPDRAAVQWKQAAAKDQCLPIKAAEIAALIAADEAFLAAHPITKQPGRQMSIRSPD